MHQVKVTLEYQVDSLIKVEDLNLLFNCLDKTTGATNLSIVNIPEEGPQVLRGDKAMLICSCCGRDCDLATDTDPIDQLSSCCHEEICPPGLEDTTTDPASTSKSINLLDAHLTVCGQCELAWETSDHHGMCSVGHRLLQDIPAEVFHTLEKPDPGSMHELAREWM